MDLRYALKIEKNLGYSHLWLMAGNEHPKRITGLSSEAQEVALKYEQLHQKAKENILRQIDSYFPDEENDKKFGNGF